MGQGSHHHHYYPPPSPQLPRPPPRSPPRLRPPPAPAPPPPPPVYEGNWRPIDFDESKKLEMIEEVRNLRIRHPKVEHLRLLVVGPVWAGKSTLINSIGSIFQGRLYQGARADTASDTGFTQLQTQKIRDGDSGNFLPFVISDIMGLEGSASVAGVRVDDIIMVLQGHVRDGYRFIHSEQIKTDDRSYRPKPTLNEKVHCVVFIFPADKTAMMEHDEDGVIAKMREVRKGAAELKIPQVVVMTMVDKACPEVRRNLKMIYRSKKIEEKMQECSKQLGVPMNNVYPVKNYHEETELRDDVDVLLLSALKPILAFANDHMQELENSPNLSRPNF